MTAAGLPAAAATVAMLDPNAVIMVRNGCDGYWTITVAADKHAANALALAINVALGVTPAQSAALFAGSLFGFDCPAADPASYDAAGHMICASNKDSHSASRPFN